MATETTSTTLTELVQPEIIEQLILDYAIDKFVMLDKVRVGTPGQGNTWSFPAWVKDSGTDFTEAASTFTNDNLETTENATITAAEVGIMRELTDYAAASVKMGEGALMQFIVEDGAALCLEMAEDDLVALFASASSSAGSTGVDCSVADFVAAMGKLNTGKARGPRFAVLDDQALLDLQSAVAASQAAVFANAANGAQDLLRHCCDTDTGYVGSLFGCPIWYSNLTDTANTAADVVSGILINGAARPVNAPIGFVQMWAPRVRELYLPDQVGRQIVTTMCYGCGEISDFNYAKLVTDA